MYYNKLYKKIENKTAVIAVVGLGYVGQPLISQFNLKGFNCLGIDIDKKKIRSLKRKNFTLSHLKKTKNKSNQITYSHKFSAAQDADVIILCLPTPLKKNKTPDMSFIINSLKSLRPYLKKGQAISLESTTYPETTEEVIVPLLKKKNLKFQKIFLLYIHLKEKVLLLILKIINITYLIPQKFALVFQNNVLKLE